MHSTLAAGFTNHGYEGNTLERETKWGARHLSKGIGNDKQRTVSDVLPLSVSIPYSMIPGKAVSLPWVGSLASNYSAEKHLCYATFGSWAVLGMVSVLPKYTHFIFPLASLGLILVKPFYTVEGEGYLHFGKSPQCDAGSVFFGNVSLIFLSLKRA